MLTYQQNSAFVYQVQQQIDALYLTTAWHRHDVDFTFMYNDADDTSHVAVLVHFFWNSLAEPAILDAGVLHIKENCSDHRPIYCTINFNLVTIDKASKQKKLLG